LYNGAAGTVVDIIDKPSGSPNSLPRIVLVQMDKGYDGPSVLPHLGERLVPFVPMRMSARGRAISGRSARIQIPLVLDWARTIHKAQGLTLPLAVVDIRHSNDKGVVLPFSSTIVVKCVYHAGDPNNTRGLALVALTRTKALAHMLLVPFGEERLTQMSVDAFERQDVLLQDIYMRAERTLKETHSDLWATICAHTTSAGFT